MYSKENETCDKDDLQVAYFQSENGDKNPLLQQPAHFNCINKEMSKV